jgi:hypothetical protein
VSWVTAMVLGGAAGAGYAFTTWLLGRIFR